MRNHKVFTLIIAALAAVVICASTSYGQIVYGQPASAGAQFIYSHWKVDGLDVAKINQSVVPISGFVPLGENLEGRFFIADASNNLTLESGDNSFPESKSTLSGVSDVRLQLSQSLAEDKLLFSLGINLPTGKKELNYGEERSVMDALALNYLSFPIRRLGEGFGLNLLAGFAQASGSLRYGGSVTYNYAGTYTPFENEGDYNPGDMFSVNFGGDTKKDKIKSSHVVHI